MGKTEHINHPAINKLNANGGKVMMCQCRQLRFKTHTWKDIRHFLLVDGKVSLEKDTENDPFDLYRKRGDRRQVLLQSVSLVNCIAGKGVGL